MVIMFGVPKEHFEGVKMLLCAYDDLIAETKVSKGTMTNVFPEFTEEIPAIFFHLLLRGCLLNGLVLRAFQKKYLLAGKQKFQFYLLRAVQALS